MRHLCLMSAALLFSAIGCATPPSTINSDPGGAALKVNGEDVGTSPASYTFKFGDVKTYDVSASKTGFFDTTVKLKQDSPEINAHAVTVKLPTDEAYNATVASEATNHWVRMQVNPEYTYDQTWQRIVNSVTLRYQQLEQIDQKAGLIRSQPAPHEYPNPNRGGKMTVRTRFIGSTASLDPLVYQLQIESKVSYADKPEEWVDYPRVFPEDEKLIAEIRQRLGVQ